MLNRAYYFMLVASLFWSLNPVAGKMALEEIAAPQLAFSRVLVAAITLFVLSYFRVKSFRPREIGWRPFVLGLIEPGLTSLLFVTSLTLLSASNTVIVMALMPFSQSIMGRIVFKEEFQLSVWIGGVLSIIGIAVFFTGEDLKGTESLWGNMLLLTVFCLMIVSQLLTRKIMKSDIPAIQVTASQMISATIIIFAYLLLFGNLDLPVQITSETKIALIYLVFSMSIPFFLYNRAMRQIPVGMASLFLVLIIPFGFFHASVFLGEEITWAKSFGAVLVMIGVALPHLLQTGRKRLGVKLQSK